jgi:hypothetical protein
MVEEVEAEGKVPVIDLLKATRVRAKKVKCRLPLEVLARYRVCELRGDFSVLSKAARAFFRAR